MTPEEIIKLKKQLPSNWAETLAVRCNLSPGHCRKVMRGNYKYSREKVVDEALNLLAEKMNEDKVRKKKVSQLIKRVK